MTIKFPLGNNNFSEIRKNGDYYIDKTDFIKELLNNSFKANLITRPRRFGKTLTMSMLEDFFHIRKDSRQDFAGLKISEYSDLCAEWMNQWPVIFLTLKSVEGNDFDSAWGMLKILVSDLCKKYSYLEESESVDKDDMICFQELKARKGKPEDIKDCLHLLMRMMNAHYGKPVILLIDEYDVPLAKASEAGYYTKMLDVIRILLGKALKTNDFLKFAVVTGCLKIAKESIFTGTNNFVSDTITGERFNEYIGFTESDVGKILADTGFPDHAEEVKTWYNGYRFGSVEVYCPWDVLNHVAALQIKPDTAPQYHWENTSHNGIIRRFIDRDDLWREEHINEDFELLMDGGYIVKTITENLTYDMLHSSADNIWSLLYLTGYLTQVPASEASGTDPAPGRLALRIPNEEVRHIFKSSITSWFEDSVKATGRNELFDALWGQDEQKCSKIISDMLFRTISFHDYKEDFYHAFVAGILSFAGYKVISNREQGDGRSDILLCDEQRHKAIVIETKRSRTVKGMAKMCDEALAQIRKERYAEALEDEYDEIICYGISFFKKRCMVKVGHCK